MTLRRHQRDRDEAEAALDRWGAWRGLAGSLELRNAVVQAIAEERERCTKVADEYAGGKVGAYKISAMLQALRNGNMGQIELDHVVILVERFQAEERERCARIADEYATELLPVEAGGVARLIAARIRDERAPMAVAPLPDLAGAPEVAEDEPHG
jgi:hypothetical protein